MDLVTRADHPLTGGLRYDELRSIYINKLASLWMEDSTTERTRISVEAKIDSFVGGDLEHATEVLSALWEIVNKDGEIKVSSSTPTSVSHFRICPHPSVVRECSLEVTRPHGSWALPTL